MSGSGINRIVLELLGSSPTKWCSYVLYLLQGGGYLMSSGWLYMLLILIVPGLSLLLFSTYSIEANNIIIYWLGVVGTG